MHSTLRDCGVGQHPVRSYHGLPGGRACCSPQTVVARRHRPARVQVICAASKPSFYDILGVPQTATERDIKSAYRKKALKLHPDVNKAADAQQRFMEAKMAFETLSDAKQRAEYDRRLRMGFGSASDWRSSSSGSSSWGGYGGYGGGKRPASQPEDNYTFEDLLRDLDKEVGIWMKSKGAAGQPKSLIEELAMLGEEFVEFLEDNLGTKEGSPSPSSSSNSSSTRSSTSAASTSSGSSRNASSSGSGRSKSPLEEFEELWGKYVDPLGKEGPQPGSGTASTAGAGAGSSSSRASQQSAYSSSSGSSAAGGRAGSGAKSSEDDIDAMLAELKRKVKKTS